jgi:hypothetical protein
MVRAHGTECPRAFAIICAMAGEGALTSNADGTGLIGGPGEGWLAAPPSRASTSGVRPPGKPVCVVCDGPKQKKENLRGERNRHGTSAPRVHVKRTVIHIESYSRAGSAGLVSVLEILLNNDRNVRVPHDHKSRIG